jgi:hypothetical protein
MVQKISTDRGVTLVGRKDGFVEIRTEGNILGFAVRRDELQKTTSIYQLPELLTGNGRLTVRNSEIQGQSAQLLGQEVVIQSSKINVSQPGGGGVIHRRLPREGAAAKCGTCIYRWRHNYCLGR